jgi:hypothetical protein
MPAVWDYLSKRPYSNGFVSYEQIVSGATLTGIGNEERLLKNSIICPSKMTFAKVMSTNKALDKIRERGHYGQYLWRLKNGYEHSVIERGEVILSSG